MDEDLRPLCDAQSTRRGPLVLDAADAFKHLEGVYADLLDH